MPRAIETPALARRPAVAARVTGGTFPPRVAARRRGPLAPRFVRAGTAPLEIPASRTISVTIELAARRALAVTVEITPRRPIPGTALASLEIVALEIAALVVAQPTSCADGARRGPRSRLRFSAGNHAWDDHRRAHPNAARDRKNRVSDDGKDPLGRSEKSLLGRSEKSPVWADPKNSTRQEIRTVAFEIAARRALAIFAEIRLARVGLAVARRLAVAKASTGLLLSP